MSQSKREQVVSHLRYIRRQDVLRDPDASLLVMLRKGLVQLYLSWYEVLFGILLFASLFLLAASQHH